MFCINKALFVAQLFILYLCISYILYAFKTIVIQLKYAAFVCVQRKILYELLIQQRHYFDYRE